MSFLSTMVEHIQQKFQKLFKSFQKFFFKLVFFEWVRYFEKFKDYNSLHFLAE